MHVLPDTRHRVAAATSDDVNERLARSMERRVRFLAAHRERIPDRLDDLDREWDIERTLEANAAALALGGTLLGTFVDRRFLVVPLVVSAFLLQHALQGWCPPVPLFRRLGRRTQTEIEAERYALLALRGDFAGIGEDRQPQQDALRALDAVDA